MSLNSTASGMNLPGGLTFMFAHILSLEKVLPMCCAILKTSKSLLADLLKKLDENS